MTNEKLKKYWSAAIGLQKVDDLDVSAQLKSLALKHIYGIENLNQIENKIKEYHKQNATPISSRIVEADLVAIHIVRKLLQDDFRLSLSYYLNIHRELFSQTFSQLDERWLGQIRTYDIKKSEKVLLGKSVLYTHWKYVKQYLQYDFDCENSRIKQGKNIDDIKVLARFISNIWNAHPFVEGNTRTTAVFLIKYLESKQVKVNYNIFEDYSKVFRDALVLSSTNEMDSEDYSKLEEFLSGLIIA